MVARRSTRDSRPPVGIPGPYGLARGFGRGSKQAPN